MLGRGPALCRGSKVAPCYFQDVIKRWQPGDWWANMAKLIRAQSVKGDLLPESRVGLAAHKLGVRNLLMVPFTYTIVYDIAHLLK